MAGPRNVSVKFGNKVDEPNLQCINVGNLGGTSQASEYSSDLPIFLDMYDPGPGPLDPLVVVSGVVVRAQSMLRESRAV